MNSNPHKPVDRPTSARRGESRRPRTWRMVTCAWATLAVFIFVVGWIAFRTTSPNTEGKAVEVGKSTPVPQQAKTETVRPTDTSDVIIDDDGRTLWVSPTEGGALDLAYLAPGAQIIAAIRPADLLRNPEGKKIFQGLGPIGKQLAATLQSLIPLSPNAIEQLICGCQPTIDGKWLNTFVVHVSPAIVGEQVFAKLPNSTKKTYKESDYYVAGGVAYYLPATQTKNVLIAAPEESIGDIIDLVGQPPALRRDIERLISSTDSKRHFTIVLAPSAIFSEGQNVFAGELAPLRDALFWFLGDEFSGAALSVHCDTNFFAEIIATPTLETPPEKAARILEERIRQIPDKLQTVASQLKPQPYGRLLVERLPEMTRRLAAYARGGFEHGHAVLRCYLPPAAGHNLLMAGELTLAEGTSSALPIAGATKPTAPQNAVANTSTGGLNKVTSLKFARDTLESALEQLAQDIGVPIVIRGADLQADGITKNQSFGIDVSNKPAAEILVEILRLANPDKAATGPHDPRQKLVYIVGKAPDKTEQIVVTTRARAAERHDELPAVFWSEKR